MNAVDELLDALEDVCRAHCAVHPDGRVSSGALSPHAEALRLLARAGRFDITHDRGRIVVGHWATSLKGTMT